VGDNTECIVSLMYTFSSVVYVVNPLIPERVYSIWIYVVLYLIGYSLKVSEGGDSLLYYGGNKTMNGT